MLNRGRSYPLILILAAVNGAVCFLVVLALAKSSMPLDLSFLLLCGLFLFVSTQIVLWYFYEVVVARRVNKLSEKIKQRLSPDEIPRKQRVRDKKDSLRRLEERVDFLIESREKELVHFENLDSYRKEYLGNVSHELKTPVFNIQGYVDTLLNGGLEDPQVNADFLRKAEKSIDRLISIIDDLETITQLESGGLDLDIDAFDITALVKDVYASLELSAQKKGITLGLSVRDNRPILVLADKFRIRQVLVNLITNSIKYGRENGRSLTKISYLNDDVIIAVSDNGDGIDEKHLPRIFERFYRIDKGRSREQGGTGLGLAIVKHIIEAHGKSIKAQSRKNEGTKFTFSLPAVP